MEAQPTSSELAFGGIAGVAYRWASLTRTAIALGSIPNPMGVAGFRKVGSRSRRPAGGVTGALAS